MNAQRPVTREDRVIEMASGFITARALYAAAKLGVADLVGDHPKSASVLAEALNVDPDALYRVLRLLASTGVLRHHEPDQFSLGPLGDALRATNPRAVSDYVILWHELFYPSFANILTRLHGRSAQLETFGKPVFEMIRSNPEFAAVFYKGLDNRARIEIDAVMAAYDFSAARRIVDVGGGNGGLLFAILARHPRATGTLFDIAPAIARAEPGEGIGARCALVAGDFFAAVPTGGDLYLLKLVLHDWGDEDAARILARCRDAMSIDARLLVIEGIIGPADAPTLTGLSDLYMMIGTDNGRERTENEFAALLERTGFRLRKTIPTGSPLHILEATPL